MDNGSTGKVIYGSKLKSFSIENDGETRFNFCPSKSEQKLNKWTTEDFFPWDGNILLGTGQDDKAQHTGIDEDANDV